MLDHSDDESYEDEWYDSESEWWGQYDQKFQKELREFIENIKAAGTISTFHTTSEFVLPGLYIAGVGDITLPISESDACRMVAASKQALLGKGNEMVVDVSIRGIWELDTVEFRNPAWKGFLDTLISTIKNDLGVAAPIKAVFCKLIICEKEAMFESYRDTERPSDMFGTMMICLPSDHQGGMIELRHGEKVVQYGTDKTSAFAMSYLAWYTDIAHEIHPVSAGYRVFLTYDLTAESGLASASLLDETKNNFKAILKSWPDFARDFYVSKLEHSYTEVGLSKGLLKGNDAERIKFLELYFEGDDRIVPLLAKMIYHVHEVEDFDDYEAEEDEHLCLYDIKFIDGTSLAIKPNATISIPPLRVLQGNDWQKRVSNKQSCEDYVGNCHASTEKDYHEAVLVLVKSWRLIDFLLFNGYTPSQATFCIEMLGELLVVESKSRLANSLLTKAYQRYRRGNDDDKGVAALCALYQQRPDLFSRAVVNLKSCFQSESYRVMGKLIDVDDLVVNLEDLLITFTRTTYLCYVWKNSRAFLKGSQAARSSIQLLSFVRSVVLRVLKTASGCVVSDIHALKEILSELDGEKKAWKSFMLDGVKSFLKRHAHNRLLMTVFFVKNYAVDSPITRNLVISTLPEICKVFELEKIVALENCCHHHFNQDAVEGFLDMVQVHCESSIMVVLRKILSQAEGLEGETFLQLIVLLLKHEIGLPHYCQRLATLYLKSKVGQEPMKPTNWVRSEEEAHNLHCFRYSRHCSGCRKIRAFLLNPNLEEQVFDPQELAFMTARQVYRHDHLKISMQRTSNLIVTKTDRYWEHQHETWNGKLTFFRTQLENIDHKTLTSKFCSEKDEILSGECILHKPAKTGPPPAKRLKQTQDRYQFRGRGAKQTPRNTSKGKGN